MGDERAGSGLMPRLGCVSWPARGGVLPAARHFMVEVGPSSSLRLGRSLSRAPAIRSLLEVEMKHAPSWRERLTRRMASTPSDPAPPGSRLASFRRLYRWLNLTLVHQGLWPLLILFLDAPLVRPAVAPWPWTLAATGGPTLAALAAFLYLAQRRPPVSALGDRVAVRSPAGATGTQQAASDPIVASVPSTVAGRARLRRHPFGSRRLGRDVEGVRRARFGMDAPAQSGSASLAAVLQGQARVLLFGVTFVLAAVRLVSGPSLPIGGYFLFGVADVVAFQVIHFGVVAGSFTEEDQGQAAAVLLFVLSWGLRDLFLAGVGVGNADLGLAFGGGLAVGLGVGLLSRLLRRWPGGFWTAAAGHWLLIYLILGFAG
jgi:hypothetical protein